MVLVRSAVDAQIAHVHDELRVLNAGCLTRDTRTPSLSAGLVDEILHPELAELSTAGRDTSYQNGNGVEPFPCTEVSSLERSDAGDPSLHAKEGVSMLIDESIERSLVKSVTYRLYVMFFIDVLIVYFVFAGVIEGWAIILALEAVRFLAHFVYERIWNRVSWGLNPVC